MREINLAVNPRGSITAPASKILGRTGEADTTRLIIDVSAWAEAAIGVYSVVARRPDRAVYALGAALAPVGGIVTVDVPAPMLALAGWAWIEVRGEAAGLIIKSATTQMCVAPSVTGGDPDAEYDYPWVDGLTQAATHLGDQLEAGETLRDEMQELADQTAEYAQQTAQDKQAAAGYAGDAAGHADDAQAARQGAEQACDGSRGYAVEASESADRAESAYARVVGIDLVVDVASGELRLYSTGLDSAIDIEMIGNTLEVYQV